MNVHWPLVVALGLGLAAAGAHGAGWAQEIPPAEDDPWADEDPFAGMDDDWDDPWATRGGGLTWTGFIEGGLGARRATNIDGLARLTLGELRTRAETRYDHGKFRVDFKGDLLWDDVTDELDAELRELAVSFSPGARIDAKLGRQVLTWGTGDLLFLNDLFPKDFISFFAGRDEDYLKSPSDTVRISAFTAPINIDLAWTPRFQADNYLYGERFAFWNPALSEIDKPEPARRAPEPDTGELAVRLYRTVAGKEYAAYGYIGRWKQPLGVSDAGEPRFPRLQVWGGSVRMPFQRGLLNAEFAWYDSRDDRDGTDPAVPNSELRLLTGYEQELVRNLTLGTQVYAERLQHHARYTASAPNPAQLRDAWRTVGTLRLTWRALQDRFTGSLFLFASPSDADFYLRPSVSWRHDDQWLVAGGLNVFGGRDDFTFFSQLEDSTNAWMRVRYTY